MTGGGGGADRDVCHCEPSQEEIPILLQCDSAHLTRFWASLSLSERVASEGLGAGLDFSRGFPFSLFSLAPFAFSDSPCSVKRSAWSVQRAALRRRRSGSVRSRLPALASGHRRLYQQRFDFSSFRFRFSLCFRFGRRLYFFSLWRGSVRAQRRSTSSNGTTASRDPYRIPSRSCLLPRLAYTSAPTPTPPTDPNSVQRPIRPPPRSSLSGSSFSPPCTSSRLASHPRDPTRSSR